MSPVVKNFVEGERVWLRRDFRICNEKFPRGSSGKVVEIEWRHGDQFVTVNFGSGCHRDFWAFDLLRNPPKEWNVT